MNNLQIVDSRQTGSSLVPSSFEEIQSWSEVFSRSGLFKDTNSAAQCLVKISAGRELGFPPYASMNGMHIISGKVTMSAFLMAAAIKRSGIYRFTVVKHDQEECSIDFFEKVEGKWEKCGTSSFTLEDAKKAQLLNNPTWAKYGRNMLHARAMSNGARWYCADVFGGGVYTPEEMGAEVDEEGTPTNAPIQQATGARRPVNQTLPAQERIPEDEGQIIEENPDAAFSLPLYRELVLTCAKKSDVKLTGPLLSQIVGRPVDGKAGDEFPKLNRCELYLLREYVATGKIATTVPSEVIEAHNND